MVPGRVIPHMAAALLLLLSGCYATGESSTIWGAPYGAPGWARPGAVEFVREVVQQRHGDPAAGAFAGAVIGGLLGHALTGGGPGAVLGAAGGAAIGADASRSGPPVRSYEVFVRFDDGEGQVFVYRGTSPFRPGERVALTAQGLVRM